jgi:hypothetical protein
VPLREWHGVTKVLAVATALSITAAQFPAQAQQGAAVLFQNVRIFDGRSDTLSASSNVLILSPKLAQLQHA